MIENLVIRSYIYFSQKKFRNKKFNVNLEKGQIQIINYKTAAS